MILMFSDVHLDEKNLDVGKSFFSFVREVCDKHSVDTIYILGDIFEMKDKVPNSVKSVFIDFITFVKENNIKLFVLRGNHDYRDRQFSTLEFLKTVEGVVYIDEPTIIGDIAFIPYDGEQTVLQQLQELLNSKARFLMMHQFIRELVPYECSISCSDLTSFYRVFTGHFHVPVYYKCDGTRVLCLGSPYQRDFRDAIHDVKNPTRRGVFLFESLDLNPGFIEFDDYPRYVVVSVLGKRQVRNIFKIIAEWNKEVCVECKLSSFGISKSDIIAIAEEELGDRLKRISFDFKVKMTVDGSAKTDIDLTPQFDIDDILLNSIKKHGIKDVEYYKNMARRFLNIDN